MNAKNRIQWLHKRITEMRYPNAMRLAERFDISHRQAQRDVETLRCEFGAPLAYSPEHRGFYYTEEFALPTYTICANEEEYEEATGASSVKMADREIVQMQIPYSAVLYIPDKLTQLEMKRFIVGKESKERFLCEFHSVELFLGVLFTLPADIKIVKPEWLRSRLLQCAEHVLRNNLESDSEKTGK